MEPVLTAITYGYGLTGAALVALWAAAPIRRIFTRHPDQKDQNR